MINWYRKRKLVRLIEKLAIYNDKGIEWSRHNEQQVEERREQLLAEIRIQIDKLGESSIPSVLLGALENESMRTDITGKYIEYAKKI